MVTETAGEISEADEDNDPGSDQVVQPVTPSLPKDQGTTPGINEAPVVIPKLTLTGNLNQTLALQAEVAAMPLQCIKCIAQVTSDHCRIASIDQGSLIFSTLPSVPYVCSVTIEARSDSDGVLIDTKTLVLTTSGDLSQAQNSFLSTPLEKFWGIHQVSDNDLTACDTISKVGDLACKPAWKTFYFPVLAGHPDICTELAIVSGESSNWRWKCTDGVIVIKMKPFRYLKDFINDIDGTGFSPQSIDVSSSLGVIRLNLVADNESAAPWKNSFCLLSDGKGHLINDLTLGAGFYPAGSNSGDNDNYPNPPVGFDACDADITPYKIKVLTVDHADHYGFEIKNHGQAIVGCKPNGSAGCLPPAITGHTGSAIANFSSSYSAGITASLRNNGAAVDLLADTTISNLVIRGFSVYVNLLSNSKNVDFNNIDAEGATTSGWSGVAVGGYNIHLSHLNVFGMPGSTANGTLIVQSGSTVYLNDISIRYTSRQPLVILPMPAESVIKVYAQNVRVFSNEISRNLFEFDGAELVGNNIHLTGNSNTRAAISTTAQNLSIHGLSVNSTGARLFDLYDPAPTIAIRGLTIANTQTATPIPNNALIKSAIFAYNRGRAFTVTAPAVATIQDALVGSNAWNSAAACAASVDPFTGNEWCASAGLIQTGISQGTPNFRFNDNSRTGSHTNLSNLRALEKWQSLSSYAVGLATTLNAYPSTTSYVWDTSLKTGSPGLNYYPVCRTEDAYELLMDDKGNENGICEIDEDCIFMPNLGAYQGHGAFIDHCANGEGSIRRFESNGY